MSFHIPIFLCPVAQDEATGPMEPWDAVNTIVGLRLDSSAPDGLRLIMSRNFWPAGVLWQIADGSGIDGLAFVDSELARLDDAALHAAYHALVEVMTRIAEGIPPLKPEYEQDHSSIWWMRHEVVAGSYRDLTPEMYRQAIAKAHPEINMDIKDEIEFNGLVNLVAFIKTMQAAIQDCLSQHRHLLYIMPSP